MMLDVLLIESVLFYIIKIMKKTILTIIIPLIVLVGLYFLLLFLRNTINQNIQPDNNQNQNMEQGLQIEILQEGQGERAQAGNRVSVHYTGRLEDGTKFDSSLDRQVPFPFTLGVGEVIRGWDEGVLGMRVGEKRRLVISPEFGYGENRVGPIPPNSTLIFEVELLEIIN